MNELRVGIIGTGRISDLHALEYLANERARIAAVCDIDAESARTRGLAWGVPADHIFTNYHDLLALPDVDMVEILLPHNMHYQATLDAAAAGKHISLQKPMALTVSQADDMIRAADEAGVIFKVFENFIFYPPVERAKALLDAGEIGDLVTIRIKSDPCISRTTWNVPAATQAWRFDPDVCGGGPIVFDDGHHKFALAWHFMGGAAEEVHAWIGETKLPSGEVFDVPAIVLWKFSGNRFGSLEVSYSPEMVIETKHYAQDDRVELTGTKGVIWVMRGHAKMMDVPPVVMFKDQQIHTYSDMPVGWEYSFIHSTRHFIDAYFKGEPPKLTGEEGRDVLRFALAAQESAREGRAVVV